MTHKETSFASSIGCSKKLLAALGSYGNYVPLTGVNSANDLQAVLTIAEGYCTEVVAARNTYSEAVHARREVYRKGDVSILKVLSPIMSYVGGVYGKKSVQYQLVRSLVIKLRGQRLGAVNASTNALKHSVSQMGYEDMAANFWSLIITLSNFGRGYSPVNRAISMDNLVALRVAALERNAAVNLAYTEMVPKVDQRVAAFNNLSKKCQCIKNIVKSQYKFKSSQYKLVKGLKI